MMSASRVALTNADETDQLLCRLVEDWTSKLQAGEAIDLSAYVQQYPDYAEKLHDLLPAVEVLADLGMPTTNGSAERTPTPADSPVLGVLGDYRIIGQISF